MFFFIIPLPLSFPTGLPWVCPDLPRGTKWKRGGDPDRKPYSPWGLVCCSSGDRQQLSRRGHSIKPEAGQRQSFQKHVLKREISEWKSAYFLKKKPIWFSNLIRYFYIRQIILIYGIMKEQKLHIFVSQNRLFYSPCRTNFWNFLFSM